MNSSTVNTVDVTLEEMLNARERRVARQKDLLAKNPSALICFTLNIPGSKKVFPLTREAFWEGCGHICRQLEKERITIMHTGSYEEHTGYEAYYCVDAQPERVKSLMCRLEDQNPLGRIFDIDVLGADGVKFSRADLSLPGRTCLLCGQPAPVCARSRAHSVDELLLRITSIILEYFNDREKVPL